MQIAQRKLSALFQKFAPTLEGRAVCGVRETSGPVVVIIERERERALLRCPLGFALLLRLALLLPLQRLGLSMRLGLGPRRVHACSRRRSPRFHLLPALPLALLPQLVGGGQARGRRGSALAVFRRRESRGALVQL